MSSEPEKPASWLALYNDKDGKLCMDAEDALTLDDFKAALKTRVPDAEIVGVFVRVE